MTGRSRADGWSGGLRSESDSALAIHKLARDPVKARTEAVAGRRALVQFNSQLQKFDGCRGQAHAGQTRHPARHVLPLV
jgi:hypothetical protein